ncbi:MAG: (d)CMP kinase [Rickettsiaceae bacterium]
MTLIDKAYSLEESFVIALDGPSAAGKGMIGSMLAEEFSLTYFQSSLVYRGLAYICISDQIDLQQSKQILAIAENVDIFARIKNIDLQTEQIGEIASQLSVIGEVRSSLGVYLQQIIKTNPRVVMEGRDIGTVIAPKADLKIFITADIKTRANRRYKQLLLDGKECMLSDVLNSLSKRDERDKSRKSAPLIPAEDSYVIDTSHLHPDQVVQQIKNIISTSL